MAMIKADAQKRLEDFLLSMQDNPDEETKKKIKDFAGGFTDWLVDTVKTATITVDPGIPVATAGSPSAQTGSTTSPGTGSIN